MLTSDDHARIEAAVAEAEAGSSGDIFCVLSGEVSSYREVPIAWGAALALLVPPIVLAFRLRYLLAVFSGGWTAAQASAVEPQIALVLSGYAGERNNIRQIEHRRPDSRLCTDKGHGVRTGPAADIKDT